VAKWMLLPSTSAPAKDETVSEELPRITRITQILEKSVKSA